MEAKRTPLIELLERVPRDAVLAVEHDQFSSSSHPVGRLCHEAAAALEAARAEVERLADALRELEDRAQRDEALLRKVPHPAIAHCDNCGCDWLDNDLSSVGCPYCELRRV